MAKTQTKEEKQVIPVIDSKLDPKTEVEIVFQGQTHKVSGDVANILINKGKAELKK